MSETIQPGTILPWIDKMSGQRGFAVVVDVTGVTLPECLGTEASTAALSELAAADGAEIAKAEGFPK